MAKCIVCKEAKLTTNCPICKKPICVFCGEKHKIAHGGGMKARTPLIEKAPVQDTTLPKVLFVCTGNSCRSQMAEAWGRKLLSKKFQFFSAGTANQGVNPYAIEVMEEVDVSIKNNKAKTFNELPHKDFDFVITLCDEGKATCPTYPSGKTLHQTFDDPPELTKKAGSRAEILNVFRRVRDEIKEYVSKLDEHVKRAL